jgi:formylglycine-generating enzyme required for sulfatase activity
MLSVSFACVRKSGTTSQLPVENTAAPLEYFQFETVGLDAEGNAKILRSAQANSYSEDLGGGVRLEMVLIPAGTFQMGSPESETERLETEVPQHTVTLQKFYMGKFEVTQAQWRAVANLPKLERELNPEPSEFKGDHLPVERVTWYDAQEFCLRLSKKTGRVYRLPSEAEWEYAARAGTNAPFAFGQTITPDFVNYNGEYPMAGAPPGTNRRKTVVVGSLRMADAFGLYDMHGNVEEWCLDNWHDNYDGAPIDGAAWTSGGDPEYQVLRGGSWYSSAKYCRSSARNWLGPQYSFNGVGFRVVSLPASSAEIKE